MSESQFRRYTTLPYLLDILQTNKIPLLDPARWEDKNDSRYLKIFKGKKGLKSVLAICFADAPETYPHWKIYAGNSSGVCIEFYKERIIHKVGTKKGFVQGSIKYALLETLRNKTPAIDDLPFIKRFAYLDEKEYRIIFTSKEEKDIEYIYIDPEDVKEIVINPWVEPPVYQSMKNAITKAKGWEKVKIRRSTVTKNDAWGKIGEKAVKGERRYGR